MASVATPPHITRLRLTAFRSHGHLDIRCANGTVILTGANGLGKTNVLEAISMLAPGRGLRSASLDEMTRITPASEQAAQNGNSINPIDNDARTDARNDGWTVTADIDGPLGPMRAGVAYVPTQSTTSNMLGGGRGTRKVRIDGTTRKVEDLAPAVPQLWLTPSMDRLFVEGASGRRKFLDRFAQTLDVSLTRHLSAYEKAMRERNRLLQTANTALSGNSWLDALEEEMALHGVAMAAARLAALDALAGGLEAIPEAAFPRAAIALDGLLEADLRSRAAVDVEDGFRTRLAAARALDAGAGRTLEGPHRSDFLVHYAAKNMPAGQCSTGEQKALLVGLILAQAHSVAARTGDVPLLLLDEVAAHLDATRRAALADILGHLGGQSWITGTEMAVFDGFGDSAADVTRANEASSNGGAPPQMTAIDLPQFMT